jgi:addiction module RelB/DinJ family antitoxin
MGMATLSVQVDEDLKKNVEVLADSFGMNVTTLITVFFKAVIRRHEIPFRVSAKSDYNEITRQTIEDVNAKRGLIGPFDSYADLKAYLDAEDDDDEEV